VQDARTQFSLIVRFRLDEVMSDGLRPVFAALQKCENGTDRPAVVLAQRYDRYRKCCGHRGRRLGRTKPPPLTPSRHKSQV